MKTFSLTLLLALAFTARADVYTDDWSGGLIDLAAARAAAKGVTAAAFPDADEVVIDSVQRTAYRPDGTYVQWEDSCSKVLTEKGRREAGSLSFPFSAAYGTVELKKLEILKPDGRTVTVDVAKQSRVAIDSGQMASNIYDPNHKVLQAGVPEVEIGDCIRYVTRREEHHVRMPDTFSDYTVFEFTAPIRRMVYEIWAPDARPLARKELKAEVPGTVTYGAEKRDGFTVHRWEARDVPRMFEEPDMPALHTVVQRLLVSTIPDWPTVSRWYWHLSKPHLDAVTPEMKTMTAELVRGCTNDLHKVEALFAFVSQKIRYMGITTETEAPGYEPHDVRMTFDHRYGVCRDKAALLAAMLRLAGVEGFPVLIMIGPKKDADVPNPFFNHAIAAARIDGKFILMDPTAETTRERLPAYCNNRSFLVATPEGEPLLTSPIEPAENNLVLVRTTGRVEAGGRLTGEAALSFAGVNDNMYRGHFARLKPDERRRFFEGLVKAVVPGGRLRGFDLAPQDMQDRSQPLAARLEFEADDTVTAGADTALLALPHFARAVGAVNFVLGAAGLEKRKYPMVTDYACGVREHLDVAAGDAVGRALSLPDPRPIDTPTLHWSRSVRMDGGALKGEAAFDLRTVEFSPEQYLELKKVLKQIDVDRRRRPVFAAKEAPAAAPAADGADMEILDHATDIRVTDLHTWNAETTIRKKVLTYAGMKKNAEVKIEYNPAWETVEIAEARVTAPDGKVQDLSEKERNLMDAGWVAGAPRYPAAKILVASLPGVQVGSTIFYRIVQHRRDRPFFGAVETFGAHDPVARRSVRIRLPEGLAHSIVDATDGAARFARSREGGAEVLCWTAENLPAVAREDQMPPSWAHLPTVFVSAGEWKTHGEELNRALVAAATGQRAAARAGRAAARRARSPVDKVRAVRDAADRLIRLAGPPFTALPRAALTPADTTLRDGYGHAADRAILLYAMLQGAGLKPEFVPSCGWSSGLGVQGPYRDAPQAGYFDDILVRVRDAEGGAIYLNDTDQYARPGATPHEGCDALDVTDGTWDTVQPTAAGASGIHTEYDIRLDAEGAARIRVTRRYQGMVYAGFVKRFREMPPEERRRHHQELVADLSQNARAVGDLRTDLEAYPGIEEYEVDVEPYAIRDGPRLYFTLPDPDANALGLRGDERKTPLYMDGRTRATTLCRIRAPAPFLRAEMAPRDEQWRSAAGEVRFDTRTGTRDGGLEMTVTHSVRLDPAVFEASEYPHLLEVNRRLSHPRMWTVMLTAESGGT